MFQTSSALSILSAIGYFTTTSYAAYSLQDDYTSSSFASMFDFFTDNDPTGGYVNYVSQSAAESSGLYSADGSSVYMGVDHTSVATGRGRNSVRISSKKSYNHGLVILDLAHMPASTCGTWPAFWLLGPNWPNSGEIDIIEGVNSQSYNSFAAHTNAGCSITQTGQFTGRLTTPNCDVNAPGQASNAGCAIVTDSTQSYGSGFNSNGGGVYATEWTSQAISIWFFPRNGVPADITSGTPNPQNWGLPTAQFAGACDIDDHFMNQQIVFDTTFCGQWAGSVWNTDATCAPKAGTCQDYVQNNPSAFAESYWKVNALKVYQQNGAAPAPSATPTQPSAPPVVPTATIPTVTVPTIAIPPTFPAVATTTAPINTFTPGVPNFQTTLVTVSTSAATLPPAVIPSPTATLPPAVAPAPTATTLAANPPAATLQPTVSPVFSDAAPPAPSAWTTWPQGAGGNGWGQGGQGGRGGRGGRSDWGGWV